MAFTAFVGLCMFLLGFFFAELFASAGKASEYDRGWNDRNMAGKDLAQYLSQTNNLKKEK